MGILNVSLILALVAAIIGVSGNPISTRPEAQGQGMSTFEIWLHPFLIDIFEL